MDVDQDLLGPDTPIRAQAAEAVADNDNDGDGDGLGSLVTIAPAPSMSRLGRQNSTYIHRRTNTPEESARALHLWGVAHQVVVAARDRVRACVEALLTHTTLPPPAILTHTIFYRKTPRLVSLVFIGARAGEGGVFEAV